MTAAQASVPPLVAVVVLNFNGWQDTLACVKSLFDEGSAWRRLIVVCDNASADGSFEHLHDGFLGLTERLRCIDQQARPGQEDAATQSPVGDDIVLIQNGANLGFAAGCNVGVRWALGAGAQFIWLLNNDTEVAPNALGAMVERMRGDAALALCGSLLIYHDDRTMIQARGGAVYDPATAVGRHLGVHEPAHQAGERREDIEARMDYVVGASMMASRRFIEQVGLMTEDYFLYFEELDWAMRAKAAGFKLAYAPDSVVFHKEGATIGSSHRQRGSMLSLRFLNRNRLLFTRRFFPHHLWSVRRRMVFEILVFLKRRDWRACQTLAEALSGKAVHPPTRLQAS